MNLLKGLALRRVSTKGFTIVELLVVIAVVGVLATVLIVTINPGNQIKKSNDAQRKVAMKTLQGAIEQYFVDNGSYPPTDCFSGTSTCWKVGSGSFLGLQSSNYLTSLPTDPKQNGTACTQSSSYGFFYDVTGGTSYTLVTRLENTSDPQAVPSSLPGCHANYNYALRNQQ